MKNNPWINWKEGKVHLVGTPIPIHNEPEVVEQRSLLRYLGACQHHNLKLGTVIYQQQKRKAICWWILGENHPSLRKLTLSTSLAQAVEKVEHKIHPQYASYAKVFDEPKAGKLPPRRPFDHAIDLKDTFIPKVAEAYPLNPKEMDACKEFIDEHLKLGKIQKSQSLRASPFFFVQKKDRGLCPCQDYWYLNEHTVKNSYPLPLISTLIDELKGAKFFSKMDIWWGYNNIQIKEGDEWKAAFITPYGLYEPLVMFFRQCNSPPMFQAFMDSTFGDMIAEGWLIIYMDHVLVFTETKEECQERTKQVLEWMGEEYLHLKLAKCTFNQTEVEYLGLIVKNGEVHMDPTKLMEVWDWELPKLVKAVQSFIRFYNFYWKFIPNFSALAQPLHDLTRKGTPFLWSKKQDDVFVKLTEIFLSTPVICMPDVSKPFHVMTNTSLTTLGGVLMQADTNRELHPCAYHSQCYA